MGYLKRMRGAVPRLMALVTGLALLFQASGVANSIERDPLVHCCCGDHDAEHKCRCSTCPGQGELRFRTPVKSGQPLPPMPVLHSCQRSGGLSALPPLPVLLLPEVPAVPTPTRMGSPLCLPIPPPADRFSSPDRPPP